MGEGVVILAGVMLFAFGMTAPAEAAESGPGPSKPAQQTPAASVIKGDLIKIEGEFNVVKARAGKEVWFQVGKDTLRVPRL